MTTSPKFNDKKVFEIRSFEILRMDFIGWEFLLEFKFVWKQKTVSGGFKNHLPEKHK